MPNDLLLVRAQRLGGIDQRWTPSPAAASRLEDAEWDPQGGWREAPGWRAILDPIAKEGGGDPDPAFVGQGKVDTIHWWSRHNTGLQYLMWEMNGKLVVFNGSLKSWDTLATGRYTTDSPWQRTQFCSAGNSTWIVNGVDEPLRWDGERLHPAGHRSIPAAPDCKGGAEGFLRGTSYLDLGLGEARTTDTLGTGAYTYVLTEVNEFGTEGPPSPVSNKVVWIEQPAESTKTGVVINVGTKYFVLVDIPRATGDHVRARRLYRSRNSYNGGIEYATTHHFCREIPSKGRHFYIDALPDAELGEEFDPLGFGPWPRGAKFIATWQGTMWLAGMSEYPDRLVYSPPLQLENFPPNNFFQIGDSDAGEITGIYAARNMLFVFKRRGIYVVTGDTLNGFVVRTLTKDVGGHACNAVREIPGVGVVCVSDSGIYVMRGESGVAELARPEPISGPIQDLWQNRVTLGALQNAWGVIHHRRKEYLLAVPVDGNVENSLVLVYHWERGEWSIREWPMACAAESHDHRGYLFFGSNDALNHPGVHVVSHGWPDEDGTTLGFLYETVPIDMGGRYENFGVKTLQVFALTYGNVNLSIDWYRDRRPEPHSTSPKVRDQQDAEFRLPVWDTAKWSTTETWQRHHPTAIRIDPDVVCREFAFRLTGTNRIELVDWEIGIRPGNDRNLRNLNTAIPSGSAGDR